MEQRDVSYGELVALDEEFERQVKEKHIAFPDWEIEEECHIDFVQQYIDGDDDPQINIFW